MDDLKKLITPDQSQAFNKCEQARKVISVLGTYMAKNEMPRLGQLDHPPLH